jgi:hypothetical protein
MLKIEKGLEYFVKAAAVCLCGVLSLPAPVSGQYSRFTQHPFGVCLCSADF